MYMLSTAFILTSFVLTASAELAIIGEYHGEYRPCSFHQVVVTETEFRDAYLPNPDSVTNITQYDNDEKYLVGQNIGDEHYAKDKWSRIDWEYVEGKFTYCRIVYNADNETEAKSFAKPKIAIKNSCGGFPWSTMTSGLATLCPPSLPPPA